MTRLFLVPNESINPIFSAEQSVLDSGSRQCKTISFILFLANGLVAAR